jgi:uncharacterized membrane protein
VKSDQQDEQRTKLVGVATRVSSVFSGPLPPPEILQKYDVVLPGAAERILKMAESQHRHRQELEKKVIDADTLSQTAGMVLGFVIAMTAIGGGIWLTSIGKSGAGLTSIIAALAALVGVFVYGKMQHGKELAEKAKALEPGAKNSEDREQSKGASH